jgi:hypothetical protein
MNATGIGTRIAGTITAVLPLIFLTCGMAAGAPFHNQGDCTFCHDFGNVDCGTHRNLAVIACELAGEPIEFTTLPADYVDGSGGGICEVCHTLTQYYRTDGSSPGGEHQAGIDCSLCHSHCNEFAPSGGTGPGHDRHTKLNPRGPDPLDCSCCHAATSSFVIGDIVATGVCDNCHSREGAYDGIFLAGSEDNWDNGVYEPDGITLKPGNELWCASCHDEMPANSREDGSGIDAPNITGDDYFYGYYVNGHASDCSDCHDATAEHIDHDGRTYSASGNNYQSGYRLKLPMNIPRENSQNFLASDFALCFSCHSEDAIVGLEADYRDWKSRQQVTIVNDIGTDFRNMLASGTNFHKGDRLGDLYPTNSHWNHLAPPNLFTKTQKTGCYGGTCHSFSSSRYDSDLDGTLDSHSSCTTCHNPHGTVRVSDGQAADHMTRGDLSIVHSSDNNGSYGQLNSDQYSYAGGDLYCGDCHGETHGSGSRYKYYRTPLP